MLPLLCGCEYEFELRGDISDDKLCVTCVTNEYGQIHLNVETAVPVNKYGKNEKIDTSLEKLELSINGESCPLEYGAYPDYDEKYKIWIATKSARPGDVVEVKAKGVSTREACAKTTVPDPIHVKGLGIVNEEDNRLLNGDYVRVDLEAEGIEENAYYAIRMEYKALIDQSYGTGSGNLTEVIWGVDPKLDDEVIGELSEFDEVTRLLPAYYDGRLVGSRFNNWNDTYTLTGKEFKNGRLSVYAYTMIDGADGKPGSYRVILYRLSDSFYRYNKSVYMSRNNFAAEAGLAPANFSYTNVENGFGVAASLTAGMTEWLTPSE